jgi:hypothetical protein
MGVPRSVPSEIFTGFVVPKSMNLMTSRTIIFFCFEESNDSTFCLVIRIFSVQFRELVEYLVLYLDETFVLSAKTPKQLPFEERN